MSQQDKQSNPRDTQFLGFARLLFEELMQNAEKADIDFFNQSSVEAFYDRQREAIARRAYDFALCVLQDVGALYIRHIASREELLGYLKAKLLDVPDMTQWPEETT